MVNIYLVTVEKFSEKVSEADSALSGQRLGHEESNTGSSKRESPETDKCTSTYVYIPSAKDWGRNVLCPRGPSIHGFQMPGQNES